MNTMYVICKSTRIEFYPYSGPSCEVANVPPGKVYDCREDALRDASRLTAANPVGFEVVCIPDDYTDPDPQDTAAEEDFCD